MRGGSRPSSAGAVDRGTAGYTWDRGTLGEPSWDDQVNVCCELYDIYIYIQLSLNLSMDICCVHMYVYNIYIYSCVYIYTTCIYVYIYVM